MQVYDIIRNDWEFLNHNEIKEMYGINCNFHNAPQIRQSLSMNRGQLIKNKAVTNKVSVTFFNFSGKHTPLVPAATHILCNQFTKNKCIKPAGIQKWQSISPGLIWEEKWLGIFWRPYQCSRETTLRSLQFKIIHRIINCKTSSWY